MLIGLDTRSSVEDLSGGGGEGEPKENISAETYLKEAMNKEWS